jgi:hypothetical protein
MVKRNRAKLDKELEAMLARRDALMRNPNLRDALIYWKAQGFATKLEHPDVPMAMVHKARLQWLEATDAMLEESLAWLEAHRYEPTLQGAPPLTPERRDAERKALGMPELKQ